MRVVLLAALLAACTTKPAPSPAPAPAQGRPFVCDGKTCVQRHPRLPDDGEWECVEMHGAAMCRGGEPAAGVVAGAPDPAWRCGGPVANRGRICVDDAPDRPSAEGPWRCRYDHRRGVQRACTQVAQAEQRRAAPAGTPMCWLDEDCPAGSACMLAVCAPR